MHAILLIPSLALTPRTCSNYKMMRMAAFSGCSSASSQSLRGSGTAAAFSSMTVLTAPAYTRVR